MENGNPKFKVILALAFGLTAFGFAPILVRLATGYSAFLVAALRTTFAFLILIPVFISSRIYQKKEQPSKPAAQPWLLIASGVLLGLHFICWISSLYFTSVASASILVTIHPILLIVAESLVFKARFQKTIWVGVFLAFFGSLILGYSDYNSESGFSNPALGNGLALIAAVIFAIYFLIGRKVRQQTTWLDYVFPVYGYAALTCLAVLFTVDGFSPVLDSAVLLIGLGLAIGPQIMGHGSINYAVKYVSPTLLSTLILTEPILSSIMAFFFFDEWPVLLSLAGMVLILAGVILTWARKAVV